MENFKKPLNEIKDDGFVNFKTNTNRKSLQAKFEWAMKLNKMPRRTE